MIKRCPRTISSFALGFGSIFFLLASGCSTMSDPVEGEVTGNLTIFAAASLTAAFTEIGAAFELNNPETTVEFNFAGSQRLRTQLEHGAKADVFASADWRQMEAIRAQSLTSGETAVFASNQLAIIAPSGAVLQDSDAGEGPGVTPITPNGSPFANSDRNDPNRKALHYLAKPGIKLVLALEAVPVGAYSRHVIDNISADPEFGADYAQRVLANLVSEETNVRNVVQKVALGEADAGIVYVTNAVAPGVAGKTEHFILPKPFNVTATYPISALKGTSKLVLAQAFIEFLVSDPGQAILARHGFLNPAS